MRELTIAGCPLTRHIQPAPTTRGPSTCPRDLQQVGGTGDEQVMNTFPRHEAPPPRLTPSGCLTTLARHRCQIASAQPVSAGFPSDRRVVYGPGTRRSGYALPPAS